jgi:hypothetical protein
MRAYMLAASVLTVRAWHCAAASLIAQRIPVSLSGTRGGIFGIIRANFFLKPVEPPRTVSVLSDFAHCLARIAELVNGGFPQRIYA